VFKPIFVATNRSFHLFRNHESIRRTDDLFFLVLKFNRIAEANRRKLVLEAPRQKVSGVTIVLDKVILGEVIVALVDAVDFSQNFKVARLSILAPCLEIPRAKIMTK
jgi:hypothetical protein